MTRRKSILRFFVLPLGALAVGLPATAALAAEPTTAPEAQALADKYREQADNYRALGGVGYKTGIVQSAEANAAKYAAVSDQLSNPAAAAPVHRRRRRRWRTSTASRRTTTARSAGSATRPASSRARRRMPPSTPRSRTSSPIPPPRRPSHRRRRSTTPIWRRDIARWGASDQDGCRPAGGGGTADVRGSACNGVPLHRIQRWWSLVTGSPARPDRPAPRERSGPGLFFVRAPSRDAHLSGVPASMRSLDRSGRDRPLPCGKS